MLGLRTVEERVEDLSARERDLEYYEVALATSATTDDAYEEALTICKREMDSGHDKLQLLKKDLASHNDESSLERSCLEKMEGQLMETQQELEQH